MGIDLAAIQCDRCGVPMGGGAGPNYARTAVGGVSVLILVCPNPQCKKILGTVNG